MFHWCCGGDAAVQDGAARGALPLYRGTRDAVRCMIQQEGWRSLYGGLSPALLGAGVASLLIGA